MRLPISKKQRSTIRRRLLDFDKLRFELKDTMRYNDVGDYYANKIISYDMKNDIINNAILIHEFVEYVLIKSAGLTAELIDKFDTDDDYPDKYPKEYELYMRFHRMATKVEKQFIENLGLDWQSHQQIINLTKVETAIKDVTDELHKPSPSKKKLEKSRKIVQDELKTA